MTNDTKDKFEVGNVVRIVKGTEYYEGTTNNPRDTDGKIDKVFTDGRDYTYRVMWPAGNCNSYRHSDVELVEEEKVVSKVSKGTTVVFNEQYIEKKVERPINKVLPYFEGDILTVFKVKVQEVKGGIMFSHLTLIKLGGNIFKCLHNGGRYRCKSHEGDPYHTLVPFGNTKGVKRLKVYKVSVCEAIINVGVGEEVVR